VLCDEARELVSGYLDGEIDLRTQAEIDHHLQNCQACTREFLSQRGVHAAIQNAQLRRVAPSSLKRRLRHEFGTEDKPVAERSNRLSWLQFALAGALGVLVLTAGLYVIRPRHSIEPTLANEVLNSHIRSLMLDHLTDVSSTDQHTVKPWFDGKVDYAPPVHDFKEAGFPLMGGRLDYIGHQNVAALIYQRRKHLINVFVWPSTNRTEPKVVALQQHGFNLVHWQEDGYEWWAVSDLNLGELNEFVQLLRNT
jgi:anti-sigma factor RsiW